MQAAISTAHLSPVTSSKAPGSGARLVAADGRELSFLGATVHVRAQGGLAVAVLTQRFANPYSEPLSVKYTMPLPADAAVRGYSFLIGARLVRGEVDRKQAARERFARAVASGRTAGLLDQERSSVFNQELGNIPPGEELVAMIELDQRLVWLDDGQWEWRFPTVVAPRYLGAEGRVADGDKITVAVADRPQPPRVELVMHVLDALEGQPSSPTHGLSTSRGEGVEVRLDQAARLDRDIAVRWPVAQPRVGASLQAARPEAGRPTEASGYGLLTVVPPSPRSRPRATPRDLIFLIDASGSMYGAPLEQARHVMRAMIESLEGHDRLELISFGDRPHRWKRGAVEASPSIKREALGWVDRLQAEGGTEMRAGILEALAPLRDGAQRQVVLITDGLIGFEHEIVATLHEKLPRGCRLHTVGVGSGINRSLTGPAARAGGGVEVLLDIEGDPAEATRRLLARTCAPLVTELTVTGDAVLEHAPARLPDLFAGAPALLSLRLKPSGGKVKLSGETPLGPWSTEIEAPALAPGEGTPSLATLFGRERVEDLEALHARGRDQGSIDRQIEQTGLDYQIATRLTSWVAISEKRTVDPEAVKKLIEVASELPHGMNAAALGLRPAASAPVPAQGQPAPSKPAAPAGPQKKIDLRTRLGGKDAPASEPPPPARDKGEEKSDGVLFSLKELISVEERRVKQEEEERMPAGKAMASAGEAFGGDEPAFGSDETGDAFEDWKSSAPSIDSPVALGLTDNDDEGNLPVDQLQTRAGMIVNRPSPAAHIAPPSVAPSSSSFQVAPGPVSGKSNEARQQAHDRPAPHLVELDQGALQHAKRSPRSTLLAILLLPTLLALLALLAWFFFKR